MGMVGLSHLSTRHTLCGCWRADFVSRETNGRCQSWSCRWIRLCVARQFAPLSSLPWGISLSVQLWRCLLTDGFMFIVYSREILKVLPSASALNKISWCITPSGIFQDSSTMGFSVAIPIDQGWGWCRVVRGDDNGEKSGSQSSRGRGDFLTTLHSKRHTPFDRNVV